MRHKLQKTIAILSIIAVGILAVFAIISTHWSIGALKEETKDRNYYQTLESAGAISVIFQNAEGTVNTLEAVFRHEFDMQAYQSDHSYIDRYVKHVAPFVDSSLQTVEDAAGLYITLNPDFFGRDRSYEIWYTLDENGAPLYTDANANGIFFEAFDDPDAPQMQYFFQAEQHPGKTVWIDPVHDPDIDKDIITCSKAIFVDGNMIGVVGIDIYTQHTTDLISEMDTEGGGIAFLLNEEDEQIVASAQGKTLHTQSIWPACQKSMHASPNGVLEVSANQTNYVITYGHLSNDWKLAMVCTEKDLYGNLYDIRALIIVMAMVLMLLLILTIALIFRRYADPVEKAAELLRKIDPDNPADAQEKDLLQLVQRQVDQQREKDLLLAHRSRLQQAGEMLSGILHQWKQPLNKLNLLYGNLWDSYNYGEMTEEELERTVQRSREIVESMTDTIQDFRGYLEPENKPQVFSVSQTIRSVLALLEDRLISNGIRVEEDYQQKQELTGYRNALYHVTLNIINNAIDAIESSGRPDGYIRIQTKQTGEGLLTIEIYNNGGPLPAEISEALFTPYQTTKQDRDGSGLGLVISKNLIEQNMGGSLALRNEAEGVTCTIRLHMNEEAAHPNPEESENQL